MKKLMIPDFSEGNTMILNNFFLFFFWLYSKAIGKNLKQF